MGGIKFLSNLNPKGFGAVFSYTIESYQKPINLDF